MSTIKRFFRTISPLQLLRKFSFKRHDPLIQALAYGGDQIDPTQFELPPAMRYAGDLFSGLSFDHPEKDDRSLALLRAIHEAQSQVDKALGERYAMNLEVFLALLSGTDHALTLAGLRRLEADGLVEIQENNRIEIDYNSWRPLICRRGYPINLIMTPAGDALVQSS